jgi:hypothetical protein
MPTILSSAWDAADPALHREDLPTGDGSRTLAQLRHPDHPFQALVDATPAAWFDEMRVVAMAYLSRVAALDPLLQRAVGLLVAGDSAGFGWLPLTWHQGGDGDDPTGSSIVGRRHPDGERADSVVLMATNRQPGPSPDRPHAEALGVGLRVVMHLGPGTEANRVTVRVCSLVAIGLAQARDPAATPRTLVETLLRSPGEFAALQQRIGSMFGLDTGSVGFHGFQELGDGRFRLAGAGGRSTPGVPWQGYQWAVELSLAAAGRPDDPPSPGPRWRLVEQVSSGGPAQSGSTAAAPAALFTQDGASAGPAATLVARRVTRRAEALSSLRVPVELPALLQDPDHGPPWFEVMQSTIADPLNTPDGVQRVDPATLPLRSDHLAAAQAFRRAQELFDLLDGLGLAPTSCFRFARLPLRLRHRARLSRSPDGTAVNAQVRVEGAPLPWLAPANLPARPQLAVSFGAANLRHRRTGPDDHDRLSAQPMGLAADPRWAWHEFGHVLSYAATGALEFPFAHSVGDALAAILSDPASQLRDSERLRGATYPWVPIARRHDRKARLGWCWCGRRNGLRRALPTLPEPLVKGYLEEQMLSSSLFRLYLAVGGDTDQDLAVRQRAAQGCASRIVRALQLCGAAGLTPLVSADLFVTALIDADIGGRARAGSDDVEGGSWHKVIRWAFEQQGLYATDNPARDAEGVGLPPAVDLWIADARRQADGGYAPEPLVWEVDAPWQASADALQVVGSTLRVTIGNRGRTPVPALHVRAWRSPGDGALAWQPLLLAATAPLSLPADQPIKVDFELANPGTTGIQPGWVLVEASCLGDRSNLDPLSGLPTAAAQPPTDTRALIDLVANDNNLALRWISALT